MRWTAKPTQTGFYWYRGDNEHNSPELWTIAHVRISQRSADSFVFFMEDDNCYMLDEWRDGEWAGPIPMPEE